MDEYEAQDAKAVLVIDDEAGIREGCRRVLEPRGFHVQTATTLQEGLQKIQSRSFAVVLLDVMMPDGRGLDLLAPMRAIDPDIVPIIITGYATVELAVETIKAGAYDFISKPFTPDLLLITVNQGLERRRLSLAARRVRQMEEETAALAHAKEEAERLAEFKSAFTFKVAHELRTPVASAISLIRPLMRGLAGELNESQREILARIENRLDMLIDLVNDLLALAATRAVVADETLEPVVVEPIVRRVIERQAGAARAKQVTLEVETPPPLTIMATDKGLDALFSNLLSNAIKYTPEGGSVTVRLVQEGDQLCFTVSDTGIGIPAADLARLGEEFFRAQNARRSVIDGTGLGLSIVKELVRTFGGTMTIDSREGQGTTVTVLLPVL